MKELTPETRALLEAAPDILFVSDSKNNLRMMDTNLHYKSELTEFLFKNSDVRQIIELASKAAKENKEVIEQLFEIEINGEIYYLEIRCHQTEMKETLIIIRDITRRVTLENRLRDAAEKDSLTDLFNRRSFEKKISEMKLGQAENFALVIVDIDGLKLINDTLGHVEGDRLIVAATKIIEDVFSDAGFIARVGGDEFAILIDDASYALAENLVYKFKEKIREYNQTKDHYNISLSMGYSIAKKSEVSPAMLFQQADNNMYQNKLLNSASTKNNLVRSLMKTLEAKDFITEGHAKRLDEYAYKIAKAIHLTSTQMDQIELLAKFHDIGKVGIPDSILKKPSVLNEAEFTIMKTHTQIGERIARESGELSGISHLILKHHERWDGNGYPIGLSGKDIPISCRIISIVDAFDAMTNDRPYRKAMAEDNAIKEIARCSGTQFDPVLTDVFMEMIGK